MFFSDDFLLLWVSKAVSSLHFYSLPPDYWQKHEDSACCLCNGRTCACRCYYIRSSAVITVAITITAVIITVAAPQRR